MRTIITSVTIIPYITKYYYIIKIKIWQKNKPISRLCSTFLDFNVSNSRIMQRQSFGRSRWMRWKKCRIPWTWSRCSRRRLSFWILILRKMVQIPDRCWNSEKKACDFANSSVQCLQYICCSQYKLISTQYCAKISSLTVD